MADENARSVVFMPSDCASLEGNPQVSGYDFNNGVNYDKILNSYLTTGFQATNFGRAVQEINKMVSNCRLSSVFNWQFQLEQLVRFQRNPIDGRPARHLRRRQLYQTEEKLHDILGLHIEHRVIWITGNHSVFGAT